MPHPTRETINVSGEQAGQRLDRVLAGASALSRPRLKALILDGAVTIGARTIRDPGYRVNAGVNRRVAVPAPNRARARTSSFVVGGDDGIIVIDQAG